MSCHYREVERASGVDGNKENIKINILHKNVEIIRRNCVEIGIKLDELIGGKKRVASVVLQNYLSDKRDLNSQPAILNKQNPLEDLSCNLYSMLEKNKFTDLVIKCGDKAFEAHKCILCARSPVFEAMFNSTMQESVDNTVVIDDFKPGVVLNLLKFMYSGLVKDLDIQTAYDLVNAAEKYQVPALKNTCIEFLMSNISLENAVETLICGDIYDSELKTFTLSYMCREFKALQSVESWKNLIKNNTALALEVYSYAFNDLLKD